MHTHTHTTHHSSPGLVVIVFAIELPFQVAHHLQRLDHVKAVEGPPTDHLLDPRTGKDVRAKEGKWSFINHQARMNHTLVIVKINLMPRLIVVPSTWGSLAIMHIFASTSRESGFSAWSPVKNAPLDVRLGVKHPADPSEV